MVDPHTEEGVSGGRWLNVQTALTLMSFIGPSVLDMHEHTAQCIAAAHDSIECPDVL
jgi:hypothetical protein